MVRNTYIYPPDPSMRIISDIFAFTSQKMPKFNSISISGYHMQEAGATADLELAYTLADGVEYVRAGVAAGLDVDAFAPRLSFFWAIGMNYFMEVAKMRAARLLWAKLIKASSRPRTPSRWRCARTARPAAGASPRRTSSTTSRARASRRWPPRTAARSRCTPTRWTRRSPCRPTSRPASPATRSSSSSRRRGTCRAIDPWGGSHYVERLTYELVRKAQAHIAEVEELGGMAKAIAAGMPKMRIEEAAARTQARIDSGTQTIVGVNKFQVTDQAQIEVLKVDNKSVRESQIAKLQRLKAERDPEAVAAALTALTETARSGDGNLLERAVAAARAKATVGEISDAMEKVWGRHRAETRAMSGVYSAEVGSMSKDVERVRRMCEAFAATTAGGRASWSPRWARTATTAGRK